MKCHELCIVTVAELKMLRFLLGVTMDKIRNEVHQRDTWFGEKTREARLWWFGHCTEERYRVYWEKDAEDGAARKEETGKAKEVYGCAERGHGR